MNIPNGFRQQLIISQILNRKYIDNYCLNCKHHGTEADPSGRFHTCDDTWSGAHYGKGVGVHIFYSETKDICIECGGFEELQ